MTAVDTESMTALQELLDERQRYEGWILALEQRQGATAPHVYSRVHTDYTLRLERVLHRLSERTEQLRETIQGLTSRLTSLRSSESDRTDARQEAELRAMVGEYSDEEWNRLRDEADLEIAVIAEERSGVEAELAEMERIMGMVRPPQAAAELVAERKREPDVSPPAPAPTPATPPQRVASASTPGQRPASMTPSTEAPSIDNFVADWSLRRDGGGRPTPAAAMPAERQVVPSELASASEPKREQEKTLKCPECGAMNYATEWYCERCGGELATF
ncbi:MAG TPA: hypothetical protein VNU46_08445 [Gemmatimonadaceae bacterium]|jgi:hypothetical protein|nr:hypothetical protein [Gemmatimonadaceae bacterium]